MSQGLPPTTSSTGPSTVSTAATVPPRQFSQSSKAATATPPAPHQQQLQPSPPPHPHHTAAATTTNTTVVAAAATTSNGSTAAAGRGGGGDASSSAFVPLNTKTGMSPSSVPPQPFVMLPTGRDGDIAASAATRQLLQEVGGFDALLRMTTSFYDKFWADRYLRQFLGQLHTPLPTHARRLAMYMAEMMGDTARWTADTSARAQCPHLNMAPIANNKTIAVVSRFDAHHAAWYSVTRPANRVGRRFKLDDCRVWMRLMFWACREVGLADHPVFFSYFQRWIGHFIPIYEQTARIFVRLEAQWSADPERLATYRGAWDHRMKDVIDVSYPEALLALPKQWKEDSVWPYNRSE